MAAVDAVLASTQEAAATDTVRHGESTGRPVEGSTRWWTRFRPNIQCLRPIPELARPPEATVTLTTASSASQTSAIPMAKPSAGAPNTATSPPRERRTPHPNFVRMDHAAWSAAQAFAVDPRSMTTPTGAATVPFYAVELYAPPPGEGMGFGQPALDPGCQLGEVAVVAEAAERGTDGDVHRAVRQGAGPQSDGNRLGQPFRDRHRPTSDPLHGPLEDAQLRVRAEPAGH